MAEIEKNEFNLNISRYISTAKPEEEVVDLLEVDKGLVGIEKKIKEATAQHNEFLEELGFPGLS